MKQLFYGLLLWTFSTNLNAQITKSDEFEISIGQEIEISDWQKLNGNNFVNDEFALAVRKKPATNALLFSVANNTFAFEKLDIASKRIIQREEVKLDEKYEWINFKQIGEKFYAIYFIIEKGTYTLKAQEISTSSLQFTGKTHAIFTTTSKVIKNSVKIKTSNDDSKLLFTYRIVPVKKSDKVNKDIIGLHVFDNELNKLYGSEVLMPYTEAEMNNLDYGVDAKGNAYIVTEVFHNGIPKQLDAQNQINYHVELLKTTDAKSFSIQQVQFNNYLIRNAKFAEGKNDELMIIGFYSTSKAKGFNGFYAAKLVDEQLDILSFYDIPNDVIMKYQSAKQKAKIQKGDDEGKEIQLVNYHIRNIHVDQNGILTIYAENSYVTTYKDKNGNVYYTYYYNDILAIGIGSNNELLWVDKLPKRQTASSSENLGMKVLTKGNNDYVLYFDNPSNADVTSEEKLVSYGGGHGDLVALKINRTTGETERMKLFQTNDIHGKNIAAFNLEQIHTIDDDEFVVQTGIATKRKIEQNVIIQIKLR